MPPLSFISPATQNQFIQVGHAGYRSIDKGTACVVYSLVVQNDLVWIMACTFRTVIALALLQLRDVSFSGGESNMKKSTESRI